ncbi:MAG: hypothetical protein Q9N32_04855 [Gammaproteobacteria bacterium]|nr:hypothetical protein [Gammaproteobacteria bacterium]
MSHVLMLTMTFFSGSVLAIDIAQSPLFIDKSATPNVMFVLDDSGSMDWDILTVPHWQKSTKLRSRYIMRFWARGGWIGWTETPSGSKISDGTWVSYSGYCHDRNADGICYNELYLNDDGDRSDSEISYIAPDTSSPDWGLVLQHWYFWEFPYGYCSMPSSSPPPPPPSGADAADWLPNIEKIFTFLTGTKNAYAHTGVFGPSGSPYQWQGANHPSNQNTDPAYRQEVWVYKGELSTVDAWQRLQKTMLQINLLAKARGGTYKRSTGYDKRILHHAPHAHKPDWINGWSGAPTIDPLTGNITANGPLNSRTGDYHHEYLKNYSTLLHQGERDSTLMVTVMVMMVPLKKRIIALIQLLIIAIFNI